MDKLLSVIVPAYNMEAYLASCLESLIIKDLDLLDKVDVIVVNDGSKDRTLEIANEFKDRYPGIFTVVDKINGHYGSCINEGLKNAKGVFVKVLDADDSFDKEAFQILLKMLETSEASGENLDAVISSYSKVDIDGRVLLRWNCALDNTQILDFSSIIALDARVQMHALTYRLANLRKLDYHQTEGISYTDTEWCFEPMSVVFRLRYCDACVYRYLIGRADQSVNKDVICRSYWMYDRLVDEICGRYARIQCDAAHRHYLDVCIKELLAIMLYYTMWMLPMADFKANMSRLHRAILDVPSMRTVVGHRCWKRRIRWRLALWLIAHKNLAFSVLYILRSARGVSG